MTSSETMLLVGCGRMGGALARTWASERKLMVFDPSVTATPGAEMVRDLGAVSFEGRPIVVVAVKPQQMAGVLAELRPLAQAGATMVSIAAGIGTDALVRGLGGTASVVRAMPNTPVAIRQGITALFASAEVAVADRLRVERLFALVGQTLWLAEEGLLDAVTALSGSGPAYFFRFAEALAAAAERHGLAPDQAMALARATLIGAGALAAARTEPLSALREEVTSPGGTTAAALQAFTEGELDQLVDTAVAAAVARSRALGS